MCCNYSTDLFVIDLWLSRIRSEIKLELRSRLYESGLTVRGGNLRYDQHHTSCWSRVERMTQDLMRLNCLYSKRLSTFHPHYSCQALCLCLFSIHCVLEWQWLLFYGWKRQFVIAHIHRLNEGWTLDHKIPSTARSLKKIYQTLSSTYLLQFATLCLLFRLIQYWANELSWWCGGPRYNLGPLYYLVFVQKISSTNRWLRIRCFSMFFIQWCPFL